MNIYSKPGTKVRFLNKNGSEGEREYAMKVLGTEKVYTVEQIDIHSNESLVFLYDYEAGFNPEMFEVVEESLVFRLRERARIRRQITTRKSVAENKPDRISDLLEEAADTIEELL